MKVKQISYSMLRVTKQFENDRVEVVIELGPKDEVADAVKEAKRLCEKSLQTSSRGF